MMEKPKIKTRSFVHVGSADGPLVELKTLPPEGRKRYASRLMAAYMNSMFAGRAVFYPAGEEPQGEGHPEYMTWHGRGAAEEETE